MRDGKNWVSKRLRTIKKGEKEFGSRRGPLQKVEKDKRDKQKLLNRFYLNFKKLTTKPNSGPNFLDSSPNCAYKIFKTQFLLI